jgi:DNA-binding beta-propeller fold protein YncE
MWEENDEPAVNTHHRSGARKYLIVMLAILLAVTVNAEPPALTKLADVPLPGGATRFDYQSFDPKTKTLFIAHMGDGELIAFNTDTRSVVARLRGFPTVTGVLAVPELHRVFASVAGHHEVAVVDTEVMKVVGRIPAGEFPDGLAYSPETGRIFVSDERGGQETVIDAKTIRRIGTIDLGGEVGNTQYDAESHLILANAQTRNQMVVIDPVSQKIVGRHALAGGQSPHGLLIVAPKRLAFVACEGDSKLLVVDLETFQVKQVLSTGDGPDVLAFDSGLERLYVATESDVVSVFQLRGKTLEKLEDVRVAPNAHTVSVDSEAHEVYLPLENVNGLPVLRIMKAAAPKGGS